MRMRGTSLRKQQGFSILTGFILAIIMFGSLAFFLAGQGINTGFGALYSNISRASGLLTSAGYITTGFAAVTLGGATPAQLTFDTSAGTGIFNPTDGGAMPQPLDPNMFQDRSIAVASAGGNLDGYWIYRGNGVTLNTVGTILPDYVMIASGLKLGICAQINNTLHGTSLTTAPTTLTAVTDALLLGTTVTRLNPINATTITDLSATSGAGLLNGCYATTTVTASVPNYVYIHTLLAQ